MSLRRRDFIVGLGATVPPSILVRATEVIE